MMTQWKRQDLKILFGQKILFLNLVTQQAKSWRSSSDWVKNVYSFKAYLMQRNYTLYISQQHIRDKDYQSGKSSL